jgi:hypothetical protein
VGITPNRLVTVLTPLVFAPLAGTISVLAAERIPGLEIDRDQLQQIFIAGALIAFGKSGLWLKGWQDWEKGQNAVPEDVVNDIGLTATLDAGSEISAEDPEMVSDPALADGDPDLDPGYEDDDPDDGGDGHAHDNGLAAVGMD